MTTLVIPLLYCIKHLPSISYAYAEALSGLNLLANCQTPKTLAMFIGIFTRTSCFHRCCLKRARHPYSQKMFRVGYTLNIFTNWESRWLWKRLSRQKHLLCKPVVTECHSYYKNRMTRVMSQICWPNPFKTALVLELQNEENYDFIIGIGNKNSWPSLIRGVDN